MTDAELIRATAAGDARAFATLVTRYQGLACAVGLASTGDPALAEDLAQEAFVVAWRRLPGLADPDRFAPWLCGIVRNVARSTRRHQRRHAPAATEPFERARGLESEAPSPLDQVMARQRLATAWDALRRLPVRYREPLVLYCHLDRSAARVAACMGLSEEAVRQRLSRARRQLRDRIDMIERIVSAGRPPIALGASVVALVFARQAAAARSAASAPWLLTKVALSVAALSTAVMVAAGSAALRLEPRRATVAPITAPDPDPAPDPVPVPHSDPDPDPDPVPDPVPVPDPEPRHAPRAHVRHGPAVLRHGRPSVGLAELGLTPE
jgi:RNA polymerase sigma factor (sigma-70 family)